MPQFFFFFVQSLCVNGYFGEVYSICLPVTVARIEIVDDIEITLAFPPQGLVD